MSLRDAVLAALLEGESSGYDLAKGFDASVANFWMATPQQLYRELDRLAEQGLIEARVVQQGRRPNKRMFSLTEAGRDAIRHYTTTAPRPSAIRDELMVKVQAADAGDARAVRDFIAERLQWATAKLQRYQRLRARLLEGRDEEDYLAHAERVGPYLTLMRGISFEEENIRWAERALTVLERRLPAQA
ncbi:PadR family transcriptional regulator [Mycobacterium parmense]|uniref:PadR family transcriptional regulator n=1 Tax=Mycobacterium parmense TaxID=185642 RepID=A0A7I7YY05_9MYCO|nr:PadR family transcriptional regulator [Mycobacterium parmense]MCV7349910.1 PadR family transcriptional regulator [Mycobacterium parmense]ORW59207.1 PadR family transcriptional regulator [Mycobacterium parmense]BBZ46559.1 PadR family transcriptional regulator [Mycobacterium parmense]